jgi:hypothetical protein
VPSTLLARADEVIDSGAVRCGAYVASRHQADIPRLTAIFVGAGWALIGFFCPGFTDGFERREPIQSLETLGEVVGVEECLDVLAKLVVAVVVLAPNSRLFESTVHPLDLPVRPRMIWLCQPMLNPVRSAEQIEHMGLPPRSRT